MLNSCSFIGNLGKDVEVRSTTSGKQVATFSLAVSDGRGDNAKTEWVNVVVWDKLAEICQTYLKKGSKVYINGRMQTRSWEDQNGGKKYMTEIVVRDMEMLDGKRESSAPRGDSGFAQVGDDSDVPF